MTEQARGFLTEYLKIGSAVSLRSPSTQEEAAIIQSIAEDELWLRFSQNTPPHPFQVGDSVLVKFWDEGATVYSWDAQVKQMEESESQRVTLVITSREVHVQRRKSYRVRARVPFDFSIVGAARAELTGRVVRNATTENISIGGLSFDTPLPLEVGDRLEIHLHLEPSETVKAAGWVVRHQTPDPSDDHPTRLALQFLHLEDGEQARLLRFLRSYYG